MVLAMEGARRSHSLGNMIDYDEALAIYDKSRQHGFAFAVLVDGVPWGAETARPMRAESHAMTTAEIVL
jgi:hypothetical protein